MTVGLSSLWELMTGALPLQPFTQTWECQYLKRTCYRQSFPCWTWADPREVEALCVRGLHPKVHPPGLLHCCGAGVAPCQPKRISTSLCSVRNTCVCVKGEWGDLGGVWSAFSLSPVPIIRVLHWLMGTATATATVSFGDSVTPVMVQPLARAPSQQISREHRE